MQDLLVGDVWRRRRTPPRVDARRNRCSVDQFEAEDAALSVGPEIDRNGVDHEHLFGDGPHPAGKIMLLVRPGEEFLRRGDLTGKLARAWVRTVSEFARPNVPVLRFDLI